MEKKLIFLDIDGTILVPGEGIREEVLDGIYKARNRGHMIFISTGRSCSSLPEDLNGVELDGLIASAGSDIWIHGQNVWRTSIPKELLYKAFPVLDEAGAIYILENYDRIYISGLGKRLLSGEEPREEDNPELTRWKAFFQNTTDLRGLDDWDLEKAPVPKITFLVWEEKQVDKIKKALSEDFHVAMFQPGSRKFLNGELILKSADKGTAVCRTARLLKAELKNTVAFGDSMNDYQMIKAAAVGVAMGNADEKLKAAADRICEPVEENGVLLELQRMKII